MRDHLGLWGEKDERGVKGQGDGNGYGKDHGH